MQSKELSLTWVFVFQLSICTTLSKYLHNQILPNFMLDWYIKYQSTNNISNNGFFYSSFVSC